MKSGKLSIFLENNQNGNLHEAAYRYENPVEVVSVTDPERIIGGFKSIQKAIDQGYHVAGWFSYEAGLLLEDKLKCLLPEKVEYPLIHMGVYKERKILSSQDANHYWRGHHDPAAFELTDIKLSLSRDEYNKTFEQIHEYLKAGDIYQVNFTQKALFDFKGSSKAFYSSLRSAQAVEYASYIEGENFKVLSLSPELFIKKTGDDLLAKPMKGTCGRGRTIEEDELKYSTLYNSEKERAENLMIVDLLRNDLSKLAQKGSVKVSKLYDVEKYRTLFTMASTINAKMGAVSALDVMTSIFPCGSVTGAPKFRAQEIINEIESHQRGIYTGAIGYFTPNGDMCFSVPIRTITIDKLGNGELGVGGAIVADSIADSEYDECLLKAKFVTKKYPKFDLIESLLWNKVEGFKYLDLHMNRLEKSAKYFNFVFDRNLMISKLMEHSEYLQPQNYKVRLLLSVDGNITITSMKIEDDTISRNVRISQHAVDSSDPMRYHKTTDRLFLQRQLLSFPDCFDVLFVNEREEFTEGSYTNLFVKIGDTLFTPPISSGLLNGVMRQVLLENPKIKTQEKKIFLKDLRDADQVYLSNAIRGLVPVRLVEV